MYLHNWIKNKVNKKFIILTYLFRGVEEEWEDETVETVIASNTSINQVFINEGFL